MCSVFKQPGPQIINCDAHRAERLDDHQMGADEPACFLKKINKLGYPRLLQRMRDRFLHRRSYRFYFLSVRNEILLYGYMRHTVRASRFSIRIGKMLLMHSVTTLLFERSLSNFAALWRGAFQGYALLTSPNREFDPRTVNAAP